VRMSSWNRVLVQPPTWSVMMVVMLIVPTATPDADICKHESLDTASRGARSTYVGEACKVRVKRDRKKLNANFWALLVRATGAF